MEKGERKRFEFPIPFDPFRLVLAVLEKWKLILFCGLVVGGLGAAYALFVLGDTYKARVELLKEFTSEYYDPDPSRPYAPRPLDDEALMVKAYSSDVFELAAEKMEGRISAGELRGSITIEQVGGMGLFAATGATKRGAMEAYELTTAYAKALIELTATMRKGEALDEAEKLQNQLEAKRADIVKANEELQNYSAENEIFDEEKQMSTIYTNLSAFRQKREEKIAERDAKAASMKELIRKLKAPRGLRLAIEAKEKELAALRLNSTDDHPQVKNVVADLQQLNDRLDAEVRDGSTPDISASNGGDSILWDNYLRLQDEQRVADSLINRYEEELTNLESEKESLPDKYLTVRGYKSRLTEIERRTVQMEERLKDVTVYAEKNAKPLVEIFQKTTPDDVSKNSRIMKAVIFGSAGLIAGCGLAMGLSLLLEFFRRTVRTPVQAAIATKSAPVLRYDAITGKNGGTLRNFWMRAVAKFAPEERRFLFAALGNVEAEKDFWRDLFGIIDAGDNRVLFMDFSEQPLNLSYNGQPLGAYNPNALVPVSSLSPHTYNAEAFHNLLSNFPQGFVLLVRWSHSNSSSLVRMRGLFDRYYFLTSTQDAKLADVEKNARNYMEILGDSAGTILVDRDQPNLSKRMLGEVEDWFIEFRERPSKPLDPEPAV